MAFTDPMVLPADLLLIPVAELADEVRAQLECDDQDYALTRPLARTPSKIVDAQAAALLKEFRSPKTIARAVVDFSRACKADAKQTLEDAWPLLENLLQSRLLVPADSDAANRILPSFRLGDRLAGHEVIQCIHMVEDSELYQVRADGDHVAVLKMARPNSGQDVRYAFARETALLRLLDGRVNPALLEAGVEQEMPYLLTAWCPGVDAVTAAAELRQQGNEDGRRGLVALCSAILDAYAHLHSQDVIHSDIHPHNILVDADGAIKLIDYGFARLDRPDSEMAYAPRVGIGFFYEPEFAEAFLSHATPPLSSKQSEQYALASLLYLLLTGTHYLDFSLEREEMLRQIAHGDPLPFTSRGLSPWPEVEQVLSRALSKAPADRFPSVADFAAALRQAVPADRASLPAAPGEAAEPSRAAGKLRTYEPDDRLLDDVLLRLEPSSTLFTSGLPNAPTGSINMGAAGIAYTLYRIAFVRQSARLLSLADLWCAKALREIDQDTAFSNVEMDLTPAIVGRISPYHTQSGVFAVQALVSHAQGDLMTQEAAVGAFVVAAGAPCDGLDLTLGRSGTLLGCSLLLDTVPSQGWKDDSPLLQLGHSVMKGIWEQIDAYAPIPECPELRNLGIAHGWGGLLYATLRWHHSSGAALPGAIQERLHQLAGCAEPIGRGTRWPWELGQPSPDGGYGYMPGWCNGTAGYVYLWTLAHRTFGDEAYLQLAEQATWNAWEEQPEIDNLCCGLAGRAYALLNLYKHTGERAWLERARELAHRAVVSERSPEMPPHSLYKGEIGIALLVADLANPEGAAMPFFEEEGWPGPEASPCSDGQASCDTPNCPGCADAGRK